MKKRNKIDSAAGAVELFNSALVTIQPPEHCQLHAGAEAFYNAIIESRDASMWNDVDLSRAVTLANYQVMIRDNTERLLAEGEVIQNDRGTPIMSPRFSVVNTLTRLEISLSKALQTDAASTQGESRAVAKRNKASAEVRAVVESLPHDGLIPGLSKH